MNRRNFIQVMGAPWISCALLGFALALAADPGDRPNIVIVLVDDMGYSDIGCYGGEIDTPNIDRLAAAGLRFRNFYNTGRCCPTRASLLTGLHPHQAGIGHMTERPNVASDKSDDPYQGYINDSCVTIAEVLQSAGYHTLMTGKWHLGYHRKNTWPTRRGFDKYYGIHSGAADYFAPGGRRGLHLQEEKIDPAATREGEPFYITDAFTDYACEFVDEAVQQDDRPFFLYLAYNAPHWVIAAKERDLKKYEGRYAMGWDTLKEQRFERMKELGVVDQGVALAPHPGPAWDSLDAEQMKIQGDVMASYAAAIDSIDQNVGRLIRKLEDLKQFDNTVIFFLSDNGACAEGGEIGKKGFCGRAWANVSATPFRKYKHWVHEGGMKTPLIVHWPGGIDKTRRNNFVENIGYLPDFMATCLELAKATYPRTYKDRSVQPAEGRSLVPILTENDQQIHRQPICWEHERNRAVRHGKWKLVKAGTAAWELFDMAADQTEMHDLAGSMPDKRAELETIWNEWATRVGVKREP